MLWALMHTHAYCARPSLSLCREDTVVVYAIVKNNCSPDVETPRCLIGQIFLGVCEARKKSKKTFYLFREICELVPTGIFKRQGAPGGFCAPAVPPNISC